MAKNIDIGGRLHSLATEHVVAGADEILDDAMGYTQAKINYDVNDKLEIHDSAIRGLNSQNYVSVETYSELPELGSVDTVYRVGSWDGEQVDTTKYAEYAWISTGIDQGEYVLLDVKNYGIDNEPTAGSDNLVKSGGVANLISKQQSSTYLLALTDSENKVVLAIDSNLKLHADEHFLDYVIDDKLILKVNISDIIDNLNTQDSKKPLSAKQGFILNELINTLNSQLEGEITELKSMYSFVTNERYLIAIVDSNEKVLWGIKKDGKLYEPTRNEKSLNFLFVITDDNDNVVFGIKKDSTLYTPGLDLSENNIIVELQKEVSILNSNLDNITPRVNELELNDTVEVAKGSLRTSGTYVSELQAMPFINNPEKYYIDYDIIKKSNVKNDVNVDMVVINHDDCAMSDMVAIRKIYNKYGFHGNFCYDFLPFNSINSMKDRIYNMKKLLQEGHSLGLHSIIGGTYWRANKLWDVKPDGSGNLTPLLTELRGTNIDRTGENSFGLNITNSTLLSAMYSRVVFAEESYENVTIVDENLTQSDIDYINRHYVFYSDTNTVSGIDDLSVSDIEKDNPKTLQMTKLQWLEYYYNGLIDSTLGYSSKSDTLITRFAEDYSVPTGAAISDYYPDENHLLNGKMVYWGDTTNPNYSSALIKTNPGFTENSYQLVGKFTKGLYKDCFSTCNYEVMDRCVAVAQAFCRKYFNLYRFPETHYHGVDWFKYEYKGENNIYYQDRHHKCVDCGFGRFYMSRLGAFTNECNVLSEFGISFLKDSQYRVRAKYIGEIGYYYGQRNIKDSLEHFGGSFKFFNDYFAAVGKSYNGQTNLNYTEFMNFMNGIDDWFKYVIQNGGTTETRNGVTLYIYTYLKDLLRQILSARGTGKIPTVSFDTLANSCGIFIGMELLFRFLRNEGIEVVPYTTARDKILSMPRPSLFNLFPNPKFECSLQKYIGDAQVDVANVPDGWQLISGSSTNREVIEEEISGTTEKVFHIENSAYLVTDIYGLPAGTYTLTYKAKSTTEQKSNVKIKIGKNKNKEFDEATLYSDTLTDTYVEYSHDIVIPEPFRKEVDIENPISVMCNGYEENVAYLRVSIAPLVGENLYFTTPKLIKK